MSTQRKVGHETGLLRRVIENLAIKSLPQGPITHDILRAKDLARARLGPVGLVGILLPGIETFTELSERLFCASAEIERGTTFAAYQDEFFTALLSTCLERDPCSIGDTDVLMLENHISDWFAKRAGTQTIYVPCMISPWPSPRFAVGPVSLIFIEGVASSEFFPQPNAPGEPVLNDVTNLLDAMRKERAHWLAVVDVEHCDRERALEVGELAVDLAIVAFQLAAPYMGTNNMSLLSTRRGPGMKLNLSVSDGHYSGGLRNTEPGIAIGNGYLGQIVSETAPLMTAVGNCVRSFTTGFFRFPKLEQAWCDAAY
jgi:hypothetical protein